MDVRLPDGTVVTNVPEGISQSELMSRLGRSGNAPKANLLDKLDAIDKQQGTTQPEASQPSSRLLPENANLGLAAQQAADVVSGVAPLRLAINAIARNPQGANYAAQQFKKGVASGLGLPVDATTNLINLGIAGYGVAKHALTGSSDLPNLITDPFGGSGTFERLFLTNNDVQPTGPTNQFIGRLARDIGAASVPVAGMAGRPTAFLPANPSVPALLQAQASSPLPTLAAGLGLQTAATTGGEIARQVAPAPYKEAVDLIGQLAGGIAAPSYIAARVQGYNALRQAGSQENANRMALNYVENKLRNDVRNFPGAKDRLNEALALSDQIPGFNPRIGQASGVPSQLDMERRVATSSPEAFNRRALQDEQNRAAVVRQAEQDLPLLKQNDVTDRLQTAQTERQDLAAALPEVPAEETGQTLRAARSSLKGRFDQIAAQKFNAPVEEANRLGVKVNPTPIFDKVEELQSNPALQFDATNAPAIVQRIKQVIGREMPDQEAPQLYGANGQPLYSPRDRIFNIGFDQLKAMREEVGKDIARERTSPTPNARQRLRALYDLQNTIDETAQQAPKSVTDLWNSARQWYASEYAPRFLRGVNLKQSLKDITGEQRIPDEKLPGQYFKKMSPTPMSRFVTLYGDSPAAMHAMENHILDTYRREVVKDGVIDPARHDNFLRNYGPALKQLPSMQEHLQSMGNAARLLGEREGQLSQAQSLLSQAQLEKLRYDQPDGTLGIDPRKVNAFLQKNGQAFKEAVSSVYGQKVADEHIANLQKIAKASEIAERGSLSASAQPQQSTNPADMRGKLGFTGRSVFSLWRAVTTGRTSTEDMAYTLGAQHVSHRIRMAMIAAEERAVQDPETARLIAKSINEPITSPAGKDTLRKLLAKGGLYFVGAQNYEPTSRYQITPFAIQATQLGRKAAQ